MTASVSSIAAMQGLRSGSQHILCKRPTTVSQRVIAERASLSSESVTSRDYEATGAMCNGGTDHALMRCPPFDQSMGHTFAPWVIYYYVVSDQASAPVLSSSDNQGDSHI